MPFTALGLAPALQRAAAELGMKEPTPIQTAALPPLLAGRDLMLQARTGSGKTAAFALPLLQAWLNGQPEAPRPVEGLVLVPTRELALQVGGVLRDLARGLPGLAKVAVVFGGVSINPQMMGLRGGADLVVATPGRLLDLVRHNALHLDRVRRLVLDEADRLLDLGFADELAQVLELLPPQRQTVLCSATFGPEVNALAQRLLTDPQDIRMATLVAARPDIHQRAIRVDRERRTALLKHLVEASGGDRALVFVATQYATEHVADKLRRAGLSAAAFHGALSHGARTGTLAEFKAGRIQVLIATDMAARGLHIEALPLVINYELPRATEDYVHRIGRTGRAGGQGDAISFITPDDESHFRLIEKRQALRVPRETLAGFEPSEPRRAEPSGDADGIGEDRGDDSGDGSGEGTSNGAATENPATPAPAGTGMDPHGGIKGRRPSKKDKLRQAAVEAAAEAARSARRQAAADTPAAPARATAASPWTKPRRP